MMVLPTQEQIDIIVDYLHKQTANQVAYYQYALFRDVIDSTMRKHKQLLRKISRKSTEKKEHGR